MKKEDVTQDESFLDGHCKVAYALDEKGQYVVVPTRGFADEVAATTVALRTQDRLIQQAWDDARRGAASPLAYHLAVKHWTLSLAAAQMRMTRLRVWWHLKPAGFRGLSDALLARYAQELDIPAAQLRLLPDAPELAVGGL